MPEHGTMRRLPLKGVGGLVFTVAILALGVVYVPVFRLFLAIAIPIGIVIAVMLRLWHKYVRVPEPEDKKKVLHLDDH
jgi:hypothetical protein